MIEDQVKRAELRNYGSYLADNPSAAADVRTKLELLWHLRSVMRDHGFVEAPMPILHAFREGAPVQQFATESPLTGTRYYLRHCMADHLKRLAPTIPRVFELGKALRVEIEDAARAEEFLVLEAVAVDTSLEAGAALIVDVLRHSVERTCGTLTHAGLPLDHVTVISFEELARQALGATDPLGPAALVSGARRWLDDRMPELGPTEPMTDWSAMEVFMKYAVEPRCADPTMIMGFPPCLRHISPVDPVTGTASRFSLVAAGVEFCDGGVKFSVVDDYRAVHEANARLRRDLYGITDNDPPDDFFADLAHTPCSVFTFGLGVDRLFALMTGASIHDVIQFPHH